MSAHNDPNSSKWYITPTPEEIAALIKAIEAFNIDKQKFMEMPDHKLVPGTACKVTYDQNGLVTGSLPLTEPDIPIIGIDKIKGLSMELERLSKSFNLETTNKESEYENEQSAERAPLLEADILRLSIDHIDNLENILSEMQNSINDLSQVSHECTTVEPVELETAPLSLSDLPSELINRIKTLESNMITASLTEKLIDGIQKQLVSKVERNSPTTAGTYSKITIDENGLVVKGESLTKDDLMGILDFSESVENIMKIPDIERKVSSILGIPGLRELISGETDNELSSMIVGRGNYPIDNLQHEIDQINHSISAQIADINQQMNEIRTEMNTIAESQPSNSIEQQISQIESEVSAISGRLSAIEKRLSCMKD